ncbi:hypothetical protein Leryth_006015 [Lithospermum erythrorhizon]|nr:hypothetical protein Leryth_006015 [Lithospermum erythrorhizon]
MAFSNEGFSIREYTWRMRSVDVVKCWPFDHITTYDERKIKTSLPQITVKRFRWWYYELQFAISRSNKKPKRKRGLKRYDSVIEEAEESDDDRVAFKKAKAPKRRSIVELFAVAPPVQNVHDDEDEAEFVGDIIELCASDRDNDDDEGVPSLESLVTKNANCDREEKKIRRGHPESRVLLKKKFKKDKKQLIMKDDELMESKIAKKRSCKARLHSPVNQTASSSCSLIDKQHDEDSIVVGLCRKNKSQLKVIAKGKKGKVLRTSKLFSDCQKPDSSPQDIVGKLENVLTDQTSISNIFNKARDKNQHQSKKDDILGKLREGSYPETCSELLEGHRVNSSAVPLPKDCVQGTKVNFSFERITERNICRTQHSLYSMDIIRDASNVQENSSNGGEDSLLTKEHHLYDCGVRPAVSLEDFAQGNAQISGNASFTPNTFQKFDALSENNIPRVNELYSKEYATAPLQASWSSMHPRFVLESVPRNFRANSIPCYPIPRLTPKELMHTIRSPLNWKQKELMHGETRLHEDFIGLPLNSQGELIKLNSWCKTVVGHPKTSSTIASKLTTPTDVFSCRANFSDVISGIGRRQISPNTDFRLQNSYTAMSSGMVNLENQLTKKIGIGLDPFDGVCHSNYPFASDLEQTAMPQISRKLDYQTLKHVNNLHIQKNSRSCQVQSTMRLMGKEFTVGENNLQQLEDGKVWTDEQIIVENLCDSNDVEISLGLLGSTENSTKRLLSGIGASLTHLVDKESGLTKSVSSPNCEVDIVSQYEFGSVGRNPSTQYLPSFRQTPSHPFQKHGFDIQESAKCEYPYVSSHFLPVTHNVLVRRPNSNNSQLNVEVPRATSAPGFPVLHSSPTWSRGTPQRICSSWSDDSHKRVLMDCLPSFPVSLRNNYSESRSSANLLNDPSLDKPTFNCLSSPYTLLRPLFLHASSHYQIPAIPGSTLDLITQNRYGDKMNPKRQWNSRTSARGPDHCKRATKRPPILLEDSTSQFHNLSLLEDQGDTVKPAQKDFPSSEVDTHCGNREDESCFFSDVEKTKAGYQIDNYESIDGSSELSSGESNDSARSGLVKLEAGGKHMLKTSKKSGQTNIPCPTSSTIRYVETTRAQNVMQSDEKPIRIYKF